MKTKIKLGLFLICLVSSITYSCKKQTNDQGQGQVEINFSINALKSASAVNADTILSSTLTSVVVSIEDLNGKVVKNSEKIDLYNMNGSYISKPLSLPKGNYKLTRFLVLDWQDNVVYASPIKESAKAYLVTNPLPLNFGVQTNVVTKVVPEVLNAAGSKPEDFGYATFSFNVAQTFDFMVGTFVYNDTIKNYKLTPSTISVFNDTISVYSGQLTTTPTGALVNIYDAIGVTNKLTLPERYNNYTVVISKQGYKTYKQTFTKEELKLHLRSADKGPLVVILEKFDVQNGLVADVDNNIYHPITIGTQTWLIENLKTTRYRNGDLISHIEDGPTWFALTTAAYCNYGDTSIYGRLYNWYAVSDSRNICPVGYHVPSNAEWQTLIDYLGGEAVAGGKLKEAGLSHWAYPNTGATNSSGFTALPAGYRHGGSSDPYYDYKANLTWTSVFWTSTPNLSNGRCYAREIQYSQNNITNSDITYKGNGLSVRCIKD